MHWPYLIRMCSPRKIIVTYFSGAKPLISREDLFRKGTTGERVRRTSQGTPQKFTPMAPNWKEPLELVYIHNQSEHLSPWGYQITAASFRQNCRQFRLRWKLLWIKMFTGKKSPYFSISKRTSKHWIIV